MRICLWVVLMGYTFFANAQSNWGVYGLTGLNRIGVGYELGASYSLVNDHFNIGIRLYEPDLVFEKDYPGVSIAYNHSFRNSKKMQVITGVGLGVFYEKKTEAALWLIDPKLVLGTGWGIRSNLMLFTTAGVGWTINRITESGVMEKNNFRYLNYELALGLVYRLPGVTRN